MTGKLSRKDYITTEVGDKALETMPRIAVEQSALPTMEVTFLDDFTQAIHVLQSQSPPAVPEPSPPPSPASEGTPPPLQRAVFPAQSQTC